MNRKERRRTEALKQVEETALRPDVTQESIGDMNEYENVVAQAQELADFKSYGVMGPDLGDSDGIDRSIPPEPVDVEEDS